MHRRPPQPCVPVQGGIEFDALVTPGSAVACVRGLHGSGIKVAVRSPPEKGKANAEVEDVLAEYFGLPKRQVMVVNGHASRSKRIRVEGLTTAQFMEKFAGG